jgi:hypothetical protein
VPTVTREARSSRSRLCKRVSAPGHAAQSAQETTRPREALGRGLLSTAPSSTTLTALSPFSWWRHFRRHRSLALLLRIPWHSRAHAAQRAIHPVVRRAGERDVVQQSRHDPRPLRGTRRLVGSWEKAAAESRLTSWRSPMLESTQPASGWPVSSSVFSPLRTIIQPVPETFEAVCGAPSSWSCVTVSSE